MYLLHVSTGRIYRSAAGVAILLLAIQDAYSYGYPRHHTFGFPSPSDSRTTRNVRLGAAYWGEATYKTTLNLRRKITCINFVDLIGNQPKIWMSQWPPCHNPVVVITSPSKQPIDVKMEIYVERP